MKKQPVHTAVLVLLAFLFSGVGVTSVLPILITTLAPAHPVFIAEENHKISLVLHHPGNQDKHEAPAGAHHRHDLLDRIIGISTNNSVSHTDHEVELPSFKEKISTTTKSFIDDNPLFPLSNTRVFPASMTQTLEHRLAHAPPVTDPFRESFRTTILVI